MQPNHWLPLTDYALRSGISISTLRRKIKANTVEYKMVDGRYLIRCDEILYEEPKSEQFVSSDAAPLLAISPQRDIQVSGETRNPQIVQTADPPQSPNEMGRMKAIQEENALRWRAMDARISGLAKKMEMFSEQVAELKMLVKIFEEKLDKRG